MDRKVYYKSYIAFIDKIENMLRQIVKGLGKKINIEMQYAQNMLSQFLIL